jgi:long-chain acyl-CoA synthetase
MNIATNLERSSFFFPDRPAVSEAGQVTTYGQLNHKANQVASALTRMGVQPGDHVGLCAPNSTDWLAFYFGVIKAGGVAVALSSLLKKDELELLLQHARPKVLFTFDEKLDDLAGQRGPEGLETVISRGGDLDFSKLLERGDRAFKTLDRERSDTAVILYTGGTTGAPKGVMLSHENINAAIHTVVFNERSRPEDRALCFLPFNHVFGQMHIMNATILSAGCLELLPGFDMDRVLDVLAAGQVTKFFAVPTIYVRLLSMDRLKERLGSVNYCLSAAASVAAESVRQWKERTDLAIYEGYGMTEAAPTVTYNHYYRHVIGSVGTEVPGVEIQIRDQSGNRLETGQEGEICARGPNIMKGYLDNPEATEAAFWKGGWFRSGDIGLFDDDGYLFIVDRLKDMIITGGENVYPREVEDVLYTREEVEECAVIGLPDPEWGERVCAFIIPRSGKRFDQEEIRTYLKSRLSSFKVPKEYRVVKELPRSPAGKILKRELRKEVLKSSPKKP